MCRQSAANPITDVTEDSAMTWMYINGSAKADASILDPQALSPFEDNMSPPSGPADKTLSFLINQTDITTWVVDRFPFSEPKIPIVYGDVSGGWKANTTIHVPLNATIDIIMNIDNKSLDVVSHSPRS